MSNLVKVSAERLKRKYAERKEDSETRCFTLSIISKILNAARVGLNVNHKIQIKNSFETAISKESMGNFLQSYYITKFRRCGNESKQRNI